MVNNECVVRTRSSRQECQWSAWRLDKAVEVVRGRNERLTEVRKTLHEGECR